MKRIDLKSLALGILLGAAAVFTVAAASSTGRTQLEFKVIRAGVFEGDFEKYLNAAAADGWKFEQSAPFTDRYAYAIMSRPKGE